MNLVTVFLTPSKRGKFFGKLRKNRGGGEAFVLFGKGGEKQKTGCTAWTHFSLIGGYMLIDIFLGKNDTPNFERKII